MGTYVKNADGLITHYGTRDSENDLGRKQSKGGKLQEVTMKIDDATTLGTSIATKDVRGAIIPTGAYIVSATLYVDTAFTSGGAATLSLGTYNADTGAAVDADGIDSAIAVGALTDDTAIACDGAQIDTVIAATVMVAAIYGTAAFTAGSGTLVVSYFVP